MRANTGDNADIKTSLFVKIGVLGELSVSQGYFF